MLGGEAAAACDAVECLVDRGLEFGADGEVLDGAAVAADQVVVVLGEVLGELEAGPVVGGRDATNDLGALEHRQVAVGAALRDGAVELEDLGEGEGAFGRLEHVDEGTPACGEALPVVVEPGGDDHMELRAHVRSIRTGRLY